MFNPIALRMVKLYGILAELSAKGLILKSGNFSSFHLFSVETVIKRASAIFLLYILEFQNISIFVKGKQINQFHQHA